jgi:hypothetical protein
MFFHLIMNISLILTLLVVTRYLSDQKPISVESVSKRFSLVKVKAGDNFNRRNTPKYFED